MHILCLLNSKVITRTVAEEIFDQLLQKVADDQYQECLLKVQDCTEKLLRCVFIVVSF